ncbi:MAG: S41 family peptidase [Defluviitaleaceae bacterium]|nr:S41 family peptidase [Defluviitaleaceae bacterium]
MEEVKEIIEVIENTENNRRQNRSHFIKGMLFGILSFILILSVIIFAGSNNRPTVLDPSAKMQEILSILEFHSVNEFDIEVMTEAMFIGFLFGVGDPYTSYMNRETLAAFRESTEGRYAGIGVRVQIDQTDNRIQILQVFPGGPSYIAQLEPGDKIIKVDGVEVSSVNFEDAVSMMRGTPGTRVTLTILREFNNQTFEREIVRDEVEVPTVEHRMIEAGIGYIRITSFDRQTYPQFMQALSNLTQQGMQGLVIDVRNNPGGLLDSVVRITNELIPEGTVVYTVDSRGNRDISRSNDRQLNIPLAILVNENSASASEVLAGAVRDTNSGVLVGNQTFGKGVVQSLFPLSDGSGIKVTIARYYTPGGYSIHGEGLLPDILIPTDRETSMRIATLAPSEDEQLQAAIGSVRQGMGQ